MNSFLIRRIKKSDIEKLAKATGGKIITNMDSMKPADLGYAKIVEERKIGDDKMTFVEGCKNKGLSEKQADDILSLFDRLFFN